MPRLVATIHMLDTAKGGRSQPIPGTSFGCPVFFQDVPALSGHGYDCRLLLSGGKALAPGEDAEDVLVLFLSSEEVFRHVRVGTKFTLWEGKIIGRGTVTRIDEDERPRSPH